MRLPGSLHSTTLGDLLGMLHRAASSGILELVETRGPWSGRRHRVHLSRGLVAAVDTELPVARLGDILLSEAFVSRQSLDGVATRSVDSGSVRIGQVLLRERVVSSHVLAAALRYQLRRRLDSLFQLSDALIHFRVPRPVQRDGRVPLSPREFLHGRPRWRRRLNGGRHREARGDEGALRRARAVLGVGPEASNTEIRRAFRALARGSHPDRFPHASAAQKQVLMARFAELSAAYHTLAPSAVPR